MKRLIFDLFLFIFIFVFPWWISTLWAFLGLLIFKKYYEFIVSIVIINVISTAINFTHRIEPIYLYIGIILLYFFVQFLHRNIFIYKDEISFKK